jgi:Na+-transporting NADH:ubiquinone oxidoreductase subunit NqrC
MHNLIIGSLLRYCYIYMLNKNMSQQLVVVIFSILSLTGMSILASIQVTIYGQQQSQPKLEQDQTIDMSKMINEIGQQVAAANPKSNSTFVEQVIVQLAEHTAKTSSKADVNKQISQIASDVDKDPNGIVSQLLSHFAEDLALQEEGGNGYDDALVGEEQMPSVVTMLPDGERITKNNDSEQGEK